MRRSSFGAVASFVLLSAAAASAGRSSWSEVGPGVAVSFFAVSPADSGLLWAAVRDGPVFRSDDRGLHWTQPSSEVFAGFGIVSDPNDPETAYVVTDSFQDPSNPYSLRGAVARTTDGGTTWTVGAATGLLARLAADPRNSGTLYGTAYDPHLGSGVYKSIDGGATWRKIESGLPNLYAGAIATDPVFPLRVYVADQFSSSLWRSDDGGENWQATGAIDDLSASQIVVGNDPASTVFVTGSRGVWRSSDLGATWILVPSLPPAIVAVDPRFAAILYAAALTGSGRVFVSRDAGSTWQPSAAPDLPDGLVLQLVMSKSGSLYARTAIGVLRIDLISISPLPSRKVASVGAGTP
ncbi:MAG: WD40/YVTN/BNR-like repeat-containing protein [Thermoanaerobaculia bacterium]